MHTTRNCAAAMVAVAVIVLISNYTVHAADKLSEQEQKLIAVLRSDALPAEKAMTCKLLAIHGSAAAVPELGKLLSDPQLASWARIALEAIPAAAADETLRTAAQSLEGNLLIGVVNSIGVRRDAAAVETLAGRLQDPNVQVASAAAVALGHIGDMAATKALRRALDNAPVGVRSAVAEGCELAAERLLAEGNAPLAATIYDEVRQADVPQQRILEATRGAILARQQEGIPLLTEQLRSPDKKAFQMALSTAREVAGSQVDHALASELSRLAPDRAALVVVAMADRRDTVVLSAILKAASEGPKPVRLAAIQALGRVGDNSCLSPLLGMAIEADAELALAAKAALAALPDEQVDHEIVARLGSAEKASYPVLIELVGRRRIDAVGDLVKALNHSEESVRHAALVSLGSTAPPDKLTILIGQVVAPTYPGDAAVAAQALKEAAVRMPDRETCAAALAAAVEAAPVVTQTVLLETLGQVGGTKALATVAAAAKDDNAQLQDVSTRLLGEWMSIDAAPVLLELAKDQTNGKYRGRAMRGYIRIARQFTMAGPERAEMCRQALAAARQPDEQKLVLEVLKRYPSIEMLRLAAQAAGNPQIKDDARQAALAISQKLPKNAEVNRILSEVNSDR